MLASRNAKRSGPFRHRDFKLVFSGLAISTAGDWLYSIALVVYIFDRTGSSAWVAAVSIIRLLPYILFGPLGGVWADRYDKRAVLLASDLTRAAAMVLLALIALADGPLFLILALVFISTTAGAPDGPAIGSLVPVICSEDELARANAALGTVENVAMVVGPALGGLLVLLGSTSAAFLVNAVTFLVAAMTAYGLSTSSAGEKHPAEKGPSILAQLKEGLRTAASSSGIVLLMLFLFLAGLFYGHELVLVVLLAEEKLGIGSEGIGWLNAAVGIGGVAAAGLASRMAANERADRMLLIAVIGGALPYAILSFASSAIVGLAAMAVIGAAAIALDVIATTLLQRTVPRDLHGRILSLVDSVGVAGILLGSLVAPLAVELLGLDVSLRLIGTIPLLALLAAGKLRSLNREARTEMTALAPLVEPLKASILFEGVGLTALESVASAATRRSVPRGTNVVTEGERASDIYLILAGTFDVLARGEGDLEERVNTLGPGDHFGEIGVLAHVPRTATVTATSEAEVLEMPGTVLTEAVNREPTRSATIIDAVMGRLARTHPNLAASKREELIDGG